MTLFIWLNEDGEWRVTHLPPPDGFAHLRVITNDEPMFFDHEMTMVEVGITADTRN